MNAKRRSILDRKARTKIAKESVQKGDLFEERVESLYRLLGFNNVTRGILISTKKIDLLASFQIPGSTNQDSHRVLIECKNEKDRYNQTARVHELHSVLIEARKEGVADSLHIITATPWGDLAKKAAKDAGIELLTFKEKLFQLLDFRNYLQTIIQSFEDFDDKRPNEPALGKYYVEPKAQRLSSSKILVPIQNLDNFLDSWIASKDSKSQLAILGEYGTGKSSFCSWIAYRFAKEFLKSPSTARVPVVLNLRAFSQTVSLRAFIDAFLDEECSVMTPRFSLFQEMNKAGALLIILDGLDEMARRVDSTTLEINLSEIEKLSAYDNSKVILTSRIEYFMTEKEEIDAFNPLTKYFLLRKKHYQTIRLELWERPQIESFIERRVKYIPNVHYDWTYYMKKIDDIPGLTDLSKRPVLLEMILVSLPVIISSGIEINRPNLYDTYLKNELRRQTVYKRRYLFINDDDRFLLLKVVAGKFWLEDSKSITFDETKVEISANIIDLKKIDIEPITREFLTCSFFVREKDSFRFSHRSIFEYIIALSVFDEIRRDAPLWLGKKMLSDDVIQFVKEMRPPFEQILKYILQTKEEKYSSNFYQLLCGNSLSMAKEIDKEELKKQDLSRIKAIGANLRNINLRDLLLKGSPQFKDCSFVGSKISPDWLTDVIFYDCYFSFKIRCKFEKLPISIKRSSYFPWLRRRIKNIFENKIIIQDHYIKDSVLNLSVVICPTSNATLLSSLLSLEKQEWFHSMDLFDPTDIYLNEGISNYFL